jgi:Septum formation
MYSSAKPDAEQPDVNADPDVNAAPGSDSGSGSEQRRRFGAIAVTGMVLVGVLAAAAASFGIIALLTHGFRPHTTVRYRQAAEFSLRVGQCANLSPNGSAVHVISCAQPHDVEVFGTFTLPGRSWPGSAAVAAAASSGCATRLGGYLNPQLAGANLAQSYAFPGQEAWVNGERTVVCEVRAVSGQLTGSVRKTI